MSLRPRALPLKRSLALVAAVPLVIVLSPPSAPAEERRTATGELAATGPVGSQVDGQNALVLDIVTPPEDAVLLDPLPDPGAPQPAPEISVETATDDFAVKSAATASCKSYGTARWQPPSDNLCPPLHWYRGVFYVKDRTGAAWPVHSRTDYWNTVPDLTVGYGCPTTYHCVTVVQGKYGATGWIGQTVYTADSLHRFTSMTIRLNDSYSLTTTMRANTVCHELGHAAGLGHESSDNSCMWAGRDYSHTYGNSYDFNQLSVNTY